MNKLLLIIICIDFVSIAAVETHWLRNFLLISMKPSCLYQIFLSSIGLLKMTVSLATDWNLFDGQFERLALSIPCL